MNLNFRYAGEEKKRNKPAGDNIDTYWDDDFDLKDEGGWHHRHEHEVQLLSYVIKEFNINKILELGAGPGSLGHKLLKIHKNLKYHNVDGESAKRAFDRRQHSGTFFVKNLLDNFDTSDLDNDYDLVIANDFYEHIRNPALITATVRDSLTKDESYFFLSSPNWRMLHEYYYPGLFDFDNLIKFFHQECYNPLIQFPSWAQHVPIKALRLDSERSVMDDRLLDWNYYLLFKKRIE